MEEVRAITVHSQTNIDAPGFVVTPMGLVINGAEHCYLAEYAPEDIAEKLALVLEAGERSDGQEHIQHLRLDRIAKKLAGIYKAVVDQA